MQKKKQEDRKSPGSPEKIVSYGGYTVRHEYEAKARSSPFRLFLSRFVQPAALLILTVLAIFGAVALARGEMFSKESPEGGASGSLRLPQLTQEESETASIATHIKNLSHSQITVVRASDENTVYASGFLVSDDGYAVCAASFLEEIGTDRLGAYLNSGTYSAATLMGIREELGIALLKLEEAADFFAVPIGNSGFVQRGDTLYTVGSVRSKVFYGSTLAGVASSVSQPMALGSEADKKSVSVILVGNVPNDSVYGAPVISEAGVVVGFCTDAIVPEGRDQQVVIPINTVYTVVNEILAEH